MSRVKRIKRLLIYVLVAMAIIVAGLYISPYRYLLRGIRLTYLQGRTSANLFDKTDFSLRPVKSGAAQLPLPQAADFNKTTWSSALKTMLEQTGSASFLVLRNDSIVTEQYFGENTDTTCTNAFSMTKSIVTMLVQLAIQEGKIKSWEDKVITYLPWLKGPYASELTLRHLSTMTAGISWDESYHDPFGITAKAYYGDDIDGLMKTVEVIRKPGEKYHYQSGSTQLLAMALRQATGKSPSGYASDVLWSELGTEHEAFWHLDDDNGNELCYCCFNAITRDYGRIGVMLRRNGMGIIDSGFLKMATLPYRADHYGHSFWLGRVDGEPYFFMHGMQGQFIAVIPSKNMVVVRTGAGDQKGSTPVPDCIQTYVAESVKLFARK